jgi:hypothetical protein
MYCIHPLITTKSAYNLPDAAWDGPPSYLTVRGNRSSPVPVHTIPSHLTSSHLIPSHLIHTSHLISLTTSTDTMPFPDITLNDGRQIPQIGFGTWKIPKEVCVGQVDTAFEVGFDHIDSAQGELSVT